jgi:hypothetical protein
MYIDDVYFMKRPDGDRLVMLYGVEDLIAKPEQNRCG